jgi:hypothetical protein
MKREKCISVGEGYVTMSLMRVLLEFSLAEVQS